jgi:hypothetical protein
VLRSKKIAADLVVTALVPLVAVWLYELSNMAVLSAQGASVSLTVAGWVPVGVAGVSSAAPSPLTKMAQILLSTGSLLPLTVLFSKAKLFLARAFLLSTAGAFLASTYWELLSLLTVVPMAVHLGIFLVATASISFALLKGFMGPRPLGTSPSALSP